MPMPNNNPPLDVFSDRATQLMVGVIACCLPLVLWLVNGIECGTWRPATSVSQYYFTGAHVFFVGALTVVGALLLLYRGWRKGSPLQGAFGGLAGICALLVAWFPTKVDDKDVSVFREMRCDALANALAGGRLTGLGQNAEQILHFGSAALLFAFLGWTAWKRFTERSNDADEKSQPQWKEVRNRIYRSCAILIGVGILCCVVAVLGDNRFTQHWLLFFGECLALIAFGFAWLVKSRWVLGYGGQSFGWARRAKPPNNSGT